MAKTKKRIRMALVLLLPVVLLLGWFVLFEPYDWFAVKGDSWYMNNAIASKRELLMKHPSNLVFGDSHAANLNMDYVKELTGESWTMMGYGGATLLENIQDFWWAVEHTKVEKVVFGLSFYSLNDNHRQVHRHDIALSNATNFWTFVSNFVHWDEAMTQFRGKIGDLLADWTGNESYRVYFDDPSSLERDLVPPAEMEGEYRKDLLEYARIIASECQPYSCADYCYMLGEVIQYCEEQGIELTFIFFNSNRAIWEQVIFPLGIDAQIAFYKDYLKSRAVVYDMEFYNEYAQNDDYFYDGLHVVLEEKKHLMRIFFMGEESPDVWRTTPETYESSMR